MAMSYLTNGAGAVNEEQMPFQNDESIIDITQIQNKTVSSQVYDTTRFADYIKYSDQKDTIMNQIKQHIQNYGSVFAAIHSSLTSNCYNNTTGALYCNSKTSHTVNHGISIIGWDDNYSIDNFTSENRPTSNGAWIVRNSWGSNIGDNGLIYVSYEDQNISTSLYGMEKASDIINYENIYQYDMYAPVYSIEVASPKIILSNIYNKKTSGTEYLTQVSLYAPEQYTCRVYVNPNGTSKEKKDMQLVQLQAGESETVNVGYHTLEFAKPIKITGNSFVVAIEITGTRSTGVNVALEAKVTSVPLLNYVNVENGKCFMTPTHDFSNSTWYDLGKLAQGSNELFSGDSSIKAFTVSEAFDNLKDIRIVTPPNKTTYMEAQHFDKTGMVVEAIYKNGEIKTITDYTITNGVNVKANQTQVTISYKGKSVEQAITVTPNPIVKLQITKAPSKITYIEGENFNQEGMIVSGSYGNGETVEILDYTITNGTNLKVDQTQVTIKYEEQTVEQPISVEIKPASSNLDNISCNIDSLKYYTYSGQANKEYFIINTTINGIIQNTKNTKYEYYYCLLPSSNNNTSKNWVKIANGQVNNEKLQFSINSKDIKNYSEILSAKDIYICIKEVAISGTSQLVNVSKPIIMQASKAIIDMNLNDKPINSSNTSNNTLDDISDNIPDNTIRPGILPQAGVKTVTILIIVCAVIGIIIYIKYKKLNKELK